MGGRYGRSKFVLGTSEMLQNSRPNGLCCRHYKNKERPASRIVCLSFKDSGFNATNQVPDD